MSNKSVAWKLWREWVLVCMMGGAVGSFAGVLIFVDQDGTVWGTVIGWTVIGVFWGITQYLFFFDYHLPRINASWVMASVIGLLVSLAIAEPVLAALERNIGWAVVGAVGAIFQYLVLRQHFLWAYWWILANAVGVAIGEALIGSVTRAVTRQPAGGSDNGLSEAAVAMSNAVSELLGFVVGGTVGLAIYGVITGGVLVWLLRHPRVTELN